MIGYIYQIENIVNNKKYIGQTIRNYNDRWNQHIYNLNKNIHGNLYLQRSWNKYGQNNFKFNILEEIECNNKNNLLDKLNKQEEYYIKSLNSLINNGGYNIRPGGNNSELNIETKRKIGLGNTGTKNGQYGIKRTDAEKRNLSNKLKGRIPYNKGKKLSYETKLKIQKAVKENPPFKGKHHTEKSKELLRLSKLGSTHTDETKLKIGKSSKQRIIDKRWENKDLILNIYLDIMNGYKPKYLTEKYNQCYGTTILPIKFKRNIVGEIINNELNINKDYKEKIENSFLYKLNLINENYDKLYSKLRLDCFDIYNINRDYKSINNVKELSIKYNCDSKVIKQIITQQGIYKNILEIKENLK